jgi:2-dehydropantoate 2-reductase
MLTDAGFDIEVLNDAEALVWGKLVISASINPLTAILRVRNGELLTNSFARTMMGELARETYSLADSFGIKLPFLNPEHTVEAVAKQTAENQSSMLQDVLRGNPTEIDAINGAVVQLASAKGILVPANRMAWLLVKALSFNGNIEI